MQSDIYALGLILYETCTGKPPFKAQTFEEWRLAHDSSTPTPPTELSGDVDPAVERVILRCLEKDPSKRPASAANVAAALPGGDPLAAAVAAGETPSPELVAASGDEGTLPRRTAWLWLGACVLALAAAVFAWQWITLANLVPFDGGPEVLQARARHVLASLGYTSGTGRLGLGHRCRSRPAAAPRRSRFHGAPVRRLGPNQADALQVPLPPEPG